MYIHLLTCGCVHHCGYLSAIYSINSGELHVFVHVCVCGMFVQSIYPHVCVVVYFQGSGQVHCWNNSCEQGRDHD